MAEYSEIKLLKQFIKQHQISLDVPTAEKIDPKLSPIEIIINQKNYIVQVEDEYDDLKIDSELLHLVIILKEIETIENSIDFLDWCKQLNLNASNDILLSYYKDIINQLFEFKNLFEDGKLTSFISDLDFQLNAGAIQILRLN